MVKINKPIIVGTIPVRAVHSLRERTSLIIANTSPTATIYYGSDMQVTISNGLPIAPSSTAVFLEGLGDRPDLERWLVSDTAGVDVRIGEETIREKES